MWSQLLDYVVVILPFLLSLLGVHMSASLSKKGKVFLVICGCIVSTLVWVQQNESRHSHQKEINEQRQAVEGLRIIIQIQANDVRNAGELGYMRAKLDDSEKLNQKYAPAIMRLAETSAEFMRKQYEAKVTNDKELFVLTMSVVKKLREFSQKYATLQRQQTDESINAVRQPGLTEVQRQQQWNQETQKSIQLYYNRDAEFRSSILPDAMYARQELLKRRLAEPALSPMQKSEIDMVLRGSLAGPYPELALADYLEVMAKPLSQK